MCPLVPSDLLLDINSYSSDEDYVIYLTERRSGDPLPQNVSTDINPFLIEPQYSSENTWYLCLKDANAESSMRKTENAFWREVNKHEISFNGNIGWKNTLEFCEGGVRTGYMMLEYHIKPILDRDYSSLCRIFWQNEISSSLIVKPNLHKNKLSPAPSLRESNPNPNNNNNISNNDNSYIELNDFLSSSEPELSSKKSDNINNNNYCDFSKGDYLELKDILSSDSGSSSSGNSSRNYSEEYFDPDEILREIAGDCNLELLQGMEGEESVDGAVQFEGRFSVAGPVMTEQVLIRPEPDLVPVPNLHNFILNENSQDNEGASTSRTSRVKRNLSDGTSSNSSSNNCNSSNYNNNDSNNSKSPPTRRERKRNNVIRLAKFLCFAGF